MEINWYCSMLTAGYCLSVGLTWIRLAGCEEVKRNKSMYSVRKDSHNSTAFSNVSVNVKVEIAFAGERNHSNSSPLERCLESVKRQNT